MAQPPEIRAWLPWSELTGGPRLTLDMLHHALRHYPRSALLIAVARLSIIFKYGDDAKTVPPDDVTEWVIPFMFPPQYIHRVKTALSNRRVIFFQAQLRRLAMETIRLAKPHPEDGSILPDIVMGGLQLGAGELLYKPHIRVTEELDVMANLIADFLPIYEIDSLNDGFILFLRFYILLTIIIPRMPLKLVTFDVWTLFEKNFGFPLKHYYLFLYAFTMHAQIERNNIKLGDTPQHGGLPNSWFDTNTILTRSQVDTMFQTVSFSLDDLPYQKEIKGYADFEFLRDNPYFRHNNNLFCLDYEFAGSKLESGVLWRIRSSMNEKDRLAYFSFWGDVYEEYTAWIFENYLNTSLNTYYRAPHYLNSKDKRPICDAIIMCGTVAVLIEIKLGTCPTEIRYSGEYGKFKQFLEDKLVVGTNRPVGVSQLAKALNTLFSTDKADLPEWLRNTSKFIPLIITKDDIGSSWLTTAYLNARFKQMVDKDLFEKCLVSPLISMSIATLERAISSLAETSLSTILEDRINEDKQLGRPFEAASTYIHRGTPRRLKKHFEILNNLTNELITDFKLTQ